MAVCISFCSSIAQTTMEKDYNFNPANIKLELSPIQSETSLLPNMHNEDRKSSLNVRGVISGILIMTAGTVLSVNGYFSGEDHYSRYKKSAFTVNTDRIRRKVVISNLKCIGGGVIAGTGLLVTIFSF